MHSNPNFYPPPEVLIIEQSNINNATIQLRLIQVPAKFDDYFRNVTWGIRDYRILNIEDLAASIFAEYGSVNISAGQHHKQVEGRLERHKII